MEKLREATFLLIYGEKSPKAILEQFKEDLYQVKRLSKTKKYEGLLELIARYSYAMIYGYGHISIRNNRDDYRKEAVRILGALRTEKRKWKGADKVVELDDHENDGTKMVYKAFKNIIIPIEKKEPKTTSKTANKEVIGDCVAIEEITRLKAQLDTKTYDMAKGQKVEDKETFIKIALVALSTGARLKDIMEDLTVSSKKGVTYFDDGIKKEEGFILVLDTKTIQSYLKAIRSHYADRIGKVDISTGIRKAVKRLNIPNCGNTNNLNALYKECTTTP